jgi:hypothetical protein
MDFHIKMLPEPKATWNIVVRSLSAFPGTISSIGIVYVLLIVSTKLVRQSYISINTICIVQFYKSSLI